MTLCEQWGYMYTVHILCKYDRTKWDYFMEMNIIDFFNYMSLEQDIEKERELQRMMQK